jgi:ribosomal protein S18 acetylase RimI-like enzyme
MSQGSVGAVDPTQPSFPIAGYHLRSGSPMDRAVLVKFMQRNYAELDANQPLNHIAVTVDRYLSRETPIWWVEPVSAPGNAIYPVACLWLGQAIDQRTGHPHPYVLLLFVDPHHRQRGIATALLETAHNWAKQQGNNQISLQVFCNNQVARGLYQKLGYQEEAILMKKSLIQGNDGP